MQLSDILKDTDAIQEAVEDVWFQKHLKELSKLSDWQKNDRAKKIRRDEKFKRYLYKEKTPNAINIRASNLRSEDRDPIIKQYKKR